MTFSYFGPLTQTYGLGVTWTPDGSGGGTLTADAESPITVSSAQLTSDAEIRALVTRLINGEDVPTNWKNLTDHLAGDPG